MTTPWRAVPEILRRYCIVAWGGMGFTTAMPLLAQELEPRAYSAAPVGTNFIISNLTHSTGEVLFDSSVPITDISAKIDAYSLGYVRTFELAGHAASLAILLPFARANLRGNVVDEPAEVYRAGLGDLRLRFATTLLGGTALSPQEFARRPPTPQAGVSLTLIAPTGQYEPARLINVGSNRWAFKPEAGVTVPVGNWFA